MAAREQPGRAMIGLGYHGTVTPPVIRRNVLENPAWYTAYTPYQPEISQGRLEALLNFQTMVADLTGLPTAGASLLDEAHRGRRGDGAGPAAARARARSSWSTPAAAADASPWCAPARWRSDIEVVVADDLVEALQRHDAVRGRRADARAPTGGLARARRAASDRRHGPRERRAGHRRRRPARADPADAARPSGAPTSPSGSTQRFGVPLFYGGPHAGYIAVRDGLERQLPGRLVGVSQDRHGHPGVPPRAADPRAAHPPREGDLEHLHRAGAAGRRGVHVRRLPRPRRAAAHRRPPSHDKAQPPGRRPRRGGVHAGVRRASSTPSTVSVPGRADEVVAAARGARRPPAPGRTPTASASASARTSPRPTWTPWRPPSASGGRTPPRTAASASRCGSRRS